MPSGSAGAAAAVRSYMPWVWIGAAATALVVLVAVVVVWLVTRQDPNALLVPADDDYQNGAYAKAIEGYDKFLGRLSPARGLAAGRGSAAAWPSCG